MKTTKKLTDVLLKDDGTPALIKQIESMQFQLTG